MRRSRPSLGWLLLAGVLLAGCGRFGEATIRIDEAEQELTEVTAQLVDELALSVSRERPLSSRGRCELPNGDPGATNRLGVTAPVPQAENPLGQASAVLTDAGYELRPSETDDEVFASRDGMRITVVLDVAAGVVDIDAVTGCRALPG